MRGHYHDWEVGLDNLICKCGRVDHAQLNASMQRVRLAFLGEPSSPANVTLVSILDDADFAAWEREMCS